MAYVLFSNHRILAVHPLSVLEFSEPLPQSVGFIFNRSIGSFLRSPFCESSRSIAAFRASPTLMFSCSANALSRLYSLGLRFLTDCSFCFCICITCVTKIYMACGSEQEWSSVPPSPSLPVALRVLC